jgi:photosystem II stability/assembly factor-like uncharacterized protein
VWFALALAPLSAQRPGEWKVLGPGGGGAQYIPTISPHNPKHVLAGCDMTGSYISLDGGESWRMFNLRGRSRAFVWDPKDGRTIYAVGRALNRSTDLGRTWTMVYPAPGAVTGVQMSDDHAGEVLLMDGKPAPPVTALAVDPGNSKVLYAGIGSALQVSSDGGRSWRTEKDLPSPASAIWATTGAVYVAGQRYLLVREKGAWREAAKFAEPWLDFAGAPPVFYGIRANGGAVSEDGGTTWRDFPSNGARLTAIAVSARHPGVAYLGFGGLQQEGRRVFGVGKTTDYGRSFQMVMAQDGQSEGNLRDGWISSSLGPGWGGTPLGVGVAPNDPDLCYITDFGRTIRTTDGGKNWQAVYSKPAPQGWASTGLDVTTAYGVHFDPYDAKRILISYTDIGPSRSEDGGVSWTSAIEGIPRAWRNTTYWMVFDPQVRGRVWGVASGTHDLPRPKMWRTTPVSRYRGGVTRSDDGGRTWRTSNQGMPETAPTDIVLDPTSPVNARVLYVAAFGRGVYKSTDDGNSWTLMNNGIEGAEPFAWRLTRDSGGGLYLVVARRTEDGSIGGTGDGALYYSSDGAANWRKLKLPEGVNGPNGLTVDPKDPKRLYLSVWGRRGEPRAGSGGVWLSTDAGASWNHNFLEDQHVYDVTVDPRDPRVLYACGFESSAWRSADAGKTWRRIPGYDFKWGHRVIPDPHNPRMIYVTTFGGSVWHGRAQ